MRAVAAVTALVLSAAPGRAQDAEGGAGLVLSFGTTATLDDNYSLAPVSLGTSLVVENTLGLSFASVTGTQSLTFDANAVLRYADLAGQDTTTKFEDPELTLRYSRESVQSRLSFDARLRQSNLDFTDPLSDDIDDPTDLITASGTRRTTDVGLTFETGLNAPLGFIFDAGLSTRDYSETIDPDLFDTSTQTVSATVRLRFSPVTEGRFVASLEDYSAEDIEQTDRQTTDLSFGVTHVLSPVLTIDASLGYTTIDTTETIVGPGRVTRTADGISASVMATRAMTNGTATASFESEFETAGARNTLRFGRALDLPSGSLSATVGLTRSPAGDIDTVAAIAYGRDLAHGRFDASLDRGVTVDDDELDIRTTRLAVAYLGEINALSSFGLSFDYGQTEGTTAGDDVARANLRASYNRALTADWDMSLGYLYRHRDEAGVGSASSNAVFMTLERDIDFRF